MLLKYVRLLGIGATGPKLHRKRGTRIFSKETGKTYARKKNVYYLYVLAPSRLKFYEKIGFTIQRKQQRLENYLNKQGLLRIPAQ